MRSIPVILLALIIISCGQEKPANYLTFSGQITNPNSDSLKIYNKDYSKVIKVNEAGEFSDTLHVEAGNYRLYDGGEYASLFLRNGYDLNMTLNTEEFDESIKFTGIGSENSNFYAARAMKQESIFDIDPEEHDTTSIKTALKSAEDELLKLTEGKTLDSLVVASHEESMKGSVKSYGKYLTSLIKLRLKFPEGTPSPSFADYENHAGGTSNFDDLLGKYTYFDIWATWCGPCKAEIPHLKKIEADYHGKNIQFVSISIDKEKDHDKWVAMVNDKELGGIQLFADNDWNSQFVKDYLITGIPRFILVDPEGNVITPDAPRPSQDKLREMLDELL